MDFDRMKLIEQKVDIMQKEVSQVLQEMQVAIQGIAVTYSTALKVVMERLNALEAAEKKEQQQVREDLNGKEI